MQILQLYICKHVLLTTNTGVHNTPAAYPQLCFVSLHRTTCKTRALAKTCPLWRTKSRSITSSTARWRLWLLTSLTATTRYKQQSRRRGLLLVLLHKKDRLLEILLIWPLHIEEQHIYKTVHICKTYTVLTDMDSSFHVALILFIFFSLYLFSLFFVFSRIMSVPSSSGTTSSW